MGSSSYLSVLYTVILLLKVWGRTVTRRNGKNYDNLFKFKFSKFSVSIFLLSNSLIQYKYEYVQTIQMNH